jgi:hypothetical protein
MNVFLYVISLLNQEATIEKCTRREKFQENIVKGSYPSPLIPKGEKEQKNADMGSIGHRGSMDVSINAKGKYCWKIRCH